jgi:hypothetical protein
MKYAMPSGLLELDSPTLSCAHASLLALDGSRLFNLLEDCRRQYGRTARERAAATVRRWHDGDGPAKDGQAGHLTDTESARLFSLLARQLTTEEKLTLLQDMRRQWVVSLPRDRARDTILRGDDLTAVARRVIGSMRRVQASALPKDMLTVLGWLGDTDAHMLGAVVLDAEAYFAAHRLAAVMVQLATLGRLSALASPQVTVRVRARLVVPTLTIDLKFQPCFWLDMVTQRSDPSGQRLLMRLQDLALGQTRRGGAFDFASHVQGSLSTGEGAHLGELAAGVGVRTESLLHEFQAQTVAARADIQATVAVVERMSAGRMEGRVVSEHAVPGCTARIEVRSGVCPLAPYASFLSHVSRRVSHPFQ